MACITIINLALDTASSCAGGAIVTVVVSRMATAMLCTLRNVHKQLCTVGWVQKTPMVMAILAGWVRSVVVKLCGCALVSGQEGGHAAHG